MGCIQSYFRKGKSKIENFGGRKLTLGAAKRAPGEGEGRWSYAWFARDQILAAFLVYFYKRAVFEAVGDYFLIARPITRPLFRLRILGTLIEFWNISGR